MDTRRESEQLIQITQSWEATLHSKRENLIKIVMGEVGKDYFDTKVINRFNHDRKADGSYAVRTEDPILIKNFKSLINVLNSLEKMGPSLFRPLGEYIQAEGFWEVTAKWGKLAASAILNRGDIKKLFTEDISNLIYSLNELNKAIATLPGMDSEFLPIVTNLKQVINQYIEPVLSQIQNMQLDASKDTNVVEEQKKLNKAASRLGRLLNIKTSKKDIQPAKPTATKPTVYETVRNSVDAIKTKIDLTIKEKFGIEPNKKTNMYDSTDITTTEELKVYMDAANAFARFNTFLQKLDQTINRRGIHLVDILENLGHAIKEMQAIDMQMIKKIGAEKLQDEIVNGMFQAQHLIIESMKYIEATENRFGLKKEALHIKFAQVCRDYEDAAAGMQIKLEDKNKYPYWAARLSVRQQELKVKQKEFIELKNIKILLKNTHIEKDTPLDDLIRIRVELKKISCQQTYYYEKALTSLINDRTGMTEIIKKITEYENKIKEEKGNLQTVVKSSNKDIEILKDLYQQRLTLQEKIDLLEDGRNISSIEIKERDVQSNPITKAMHKDALMAVNSFVERASQDYERMISRVSQAQIHLLKDLSIERPEINKADYRLYKNIKKIEVETLYTVSLSKLRSLCDEIEGYKNPNAAGLLKILNEALKNRCGITDLEDQITHLTNEINISEKRINETNNQNVKLDALIQNLKLQISAKKYMLNTSQHLLADRSVDLDQSIKTPGIFRGNSIKKLTEAKRTALQNYRDQRIYRLLLDVEEKLPEDISSIKSPKESKKAAITPESTEEIVTRLQNEKIGTWSVSIAAMHDQFLNMCLQYLDANQMDALTKTKDGIYAISISDPLLLKNMKAMLNVMIRFEKLSAVMQSQLGGIINASGMLGMGGAFLSFGFKGLPELRGLSNQLQSELKELEFYMGELSQVLPNLPGIGQLSEQSIVEKINQLPGIDRLNRLVGQSVDEPLEKNNIPADPNSIGSIAGSYITSTTTYLTSLKEWFSMPGLSDVLKFDYHTKIHGMLEAIDNTSKLEVTVQSTKQPQQFEPLNSPIASLNRHIKDKHRIESKENGSYNIKKALKTIVNDDKIKNEVKNILIVTNALVDLQKALKCSLNVAEGNKVSGTFRAVLNFYTVFDNLSKLSGEISPEVKIILNHSIELIHPLLKQMATQIELAETQLGLTPELLTSELAKLCHSYEEMAEGYGAHLVGRYPYTQEKIQALESELEQQNNTLTILTDLYNQIPKRGQPDGKKTISPDDLDYPRYFKNTSLAEVIKLRNTVAMLPPSLGASYLRGIEKIIAERTGLDVLEANIQAHKNNIINYEIKLSQLESKKITLSDQISALDETSKTIVALKERYLDISKKRKAFSIGEIEFLYSLKPHEFTSLEKFTEMLYTNKENAIKFFNNKIASIPVDQKYLQYKVDTVVREMKSNTTELNQCRHELNEATVAIQSTVPKEKISDFDLKADTPDLKELKAALEKSIPQTKQKINNTQNRIAKLKTELEAALAKKHDIEIDQPKASPSTTKKIMYKLHKKLSRPNTPTTSPIGSPIPSPAPSRRLTSSSPIPRNDKKIAVSEGGEISTELPQHGRKFFGK